MKVARSAQTCALGSAIAGAVAAGAYPRFADAQRAMCGVKPRSFKPDPGRHKIYTELYALYGQLHDAFGTKTEAGSLYNVMKDLLRIRDRELES
jgi:L-ribulokinase